MPGGETTSMLCGGGGSLSCETVTCVRFWKRMLLDPKRYERERFLISLDFRKNYVPEKRCARSSRGKSPKSLFPASLEPKKDLRRHSMVRTVLLQGYSSFSGDTHCPPRMGCPLRHRDGGNDDDGALFLSSCLDQRCSPAPNNKVPPFPPSPICLLSSPKVRWWYANGGGGGGGGGRRKRPFLFLSLNDLFPDKGEKRNRSGDKLPSKYDIRRFACSNGRAWRLRGCLPQKVHWMQKEVKKSGEFKCSQSVSSEGRLSPSFSFFLPAAVGPQVY